MAPVKLSKPSDMLRLTSFEATEEDTEPWEQKKFRLTRPLTEDERTAKDKHEGEEALRKAKEMAEKMNSLNPQSIWEAVPQTSDALLAFAVDWALLSQVETVEGHIKPFVEQQVVKYLGQKEQSLIDYVMSLLSSSVSPSALTTELRMVLEEEAGNFVELLWRQLVFHTIRIRRERAVK